jgi:hypothetical protein
MAAMANGMWTTRTKIFWNDTECVKRCHPDVVQLKNCGKQRKKARTKKTNQDKPLKSDERIGLTLVAEPHCFSFGLCQQFLICVGDWQVATLDEPDDLFHTCTKLISKTFDARASAEAHKFKEDNTSCQAQNAAVDTALREGSKVAAKGKPKIQNESKSATPA